MSALVEHANRELRLAGLFSGTDPVDGMIASTLLELINGIAGQGHSGSTIAMTLNLFDRLVNYQPLTPLTGSPDEWRDMSDYESAAKGTIMQNVRCSSVFLRDGVARDVNMKPVYVPPDGVSYTLSTDEAPVVEFPYMPSFPPVVRVDAAGLPIQ